MGANPPKIAPCELLRHLPPTNRCAFRKRQSQWEMVPVRPLMGYLGLRSWEPVPDGRMLEGTRFTQLDSTATRRLSDARKSGWIADAVVDDIFTGFGDAYLMRNLYPEDEFAEEPCVKMTDDDWAILRFLNETEGEALTLARAVGDALGWSPMTPGPKMRRLVTLGLIEARTVREAVGRCKRLDGYRLTPAGREACRAGRVPVGSPTSQEA